MNNLTVSKYTKRERLIRTSVFTLVYSFLTLLVLVSLIPFLMVMVNATRTGASIQANGFSLIPGTAFIENWETLNLFANILLGFRNSLMVSVSVTVLAGYFSALTAYGFYVYRFKLNNFLFGFILIFMMVPTQLSFLGFYEFMSQLGLIDSFIPLIIPSIASIGTVFFLRQFTSGVLNKELIESARIDGANEFYIFHRIGLPIMMPGVATMSIFTFIGSWNNYLGARIILNSPSKFTLPLQLANLRGSTVWFTNMGALYVGLMISIVPIVIIFIAFSRYIVDSISAGAVKG